MALFPRLSSSDAIAQMSAFIGLEPDRIADQADARLEGLNVTHTSAGGSRLEAAAVREIRTQIRALAREAGYPNRVRLEDQQRFDLQTALFLKGLGGLDAGEAIRAETWQYIAAGLLPDVVSWRWGDLDGESAVSPDRYLGGNRNCFGRLWHRAAVLLDDRLDDEALPLRLLREDNFVALLERSSFSAQPVPCREMARAFLLRRELARDADGRRLEEALLRDAMCRVTRMTGYGALWALDDVDLRVQMARILDAALRALDVTPVPEAELLELQPRLALRGVAVGVATAPPTPPAPPSTPTAPEDEPRTSFEAMAPAERTMAVWRLLLGLGDRRQDELVRLAAHALRVQGQVSFERLREGGQVFMMVEEAIERGVRAGRFDKPQRGHRRAIVSSVLEVPRPVVAEVLRGVLRDGCPEDVVIPVTARELQAVIGLSNEDDAQSLVRSVFLEMDTTGALTRRGDLAFTADSAEVDGEVETQKEVGDLRTAAMHVAKELGIEAIDRTHVGGALWLIADPERQDLVDRLRALGLDPRFASHGSGTTGRRPAWWVQVE